MNDVRFDLRSSLAEEGFPEGVAYLTDSSPNRAGLVIVNLATGDSWRYLDGHMSVQAVQQFVPSYDGVPFYSIPSDMSGAVAFQSRFAADGLALGGDGEWLYYSPLASRRLYRVPTKLLRKKPGPPNNLYGNILVQRAVQDTGEKGGHSDGFETDSKASCRNVTSPSIMTEISYIRAGSISRSPNTMPYTGTIQTLV